MIHPTVEVEIPRALPDTETQHPVLAQLRKVLREHMRINPRLTLNGMSKKCSVSEPTLRRIVKGQVKTLITANTLLELLIYLSKETDLKKIIARYPGPIGEYLADHLDMTVEGGPEHKVPEHLNQVLNDPTKYLIFKMAANSCGVSADEIREMFGMHGLARLGELERLEVLVKNDDRYFADMGSFALSHDLFVQNFKATAEFIKPDKLGQIPYNNLFINFSRSVNLSVYQEVAKIQKEALKKCLKLISADSSKGPIPMFVLAAVDTLSHKSAAEIDEK